MVDTFFFVRILYMFVIIMIFWYSMMRSSTKQAGSWIWWDGVAFENSSREHSLGQSLFFALDQFGHSWDGPSLYKKLQYFRAGQTSAASTNLTISSGRIYCQQPFFESMSSCGKKSPVFLAVWNGSSFQCINSTPWNSSNGFLAYKNHIHSSGPVVGRGCFLFWWWVVFIVHKQFISQPMSLPLTAFFRRCYMDRVSVVLPLAMESRQFFKGSISSFMVHVW